MKQLLTRRDFVAAVCLAFASGCSGASDADYLPESAIAKQSLVAALDAWKAGKKPDPLRVGEHEVRIEDSVWRKGAKLQSYEITAEPPPEGPVKFTVKMTLSSSRAPETLDYYVVGKGPYWVFRDADYNRSGGM